MTGTKIIIANWKMHLDARESVLLAHDLCEQLQTIHIRQDVAVVVCPSFDALAAVGEVIHGSRILMGAQDVFWQERGAYTGEIAPSMLAALGCSLVIVGHSERRKYLRETDEMVNLKLRAALSANLIPVLCVGETYDQRIAGSTDDVIRRQVAAGVHRVVVQPDQSLIIAYEPVWAIGTGQAIEPHQARHAASVIRQALLDTLPTSIVERQTAVIYGGSVDESNSGDFTSLEGLSGALVGGASLNIDTFIKILKNS